MTKLDLAEQLIIYHLEDGVEALTAHESDLSEGLSYDEIEEALDAANTYPHTLAGEVCL